MSWEISLGDGLLVSFLVFVVFVLYNKLSRGKCASSRNMSGKVIIVTGCTSGIGKETARDLAKRGARVIMACRTLSTANAVKDEIIAQTGNTQVEVRKLDLSSLQSVRDFCADILKTERKIDVLIHNAGTAEVFKKLKSPEGYELTMATNQYGPFLMTHLLIDLLKKSKPCRIVIVASSWHLIAYHSMENGGNHVDGLPWFLYYLSKYANIQFTIELARRLQGTGVTVNCLHPGLIDTGIWRNVPFPLNLGLNLLIKCFFKDTVEGAQTTLHLAVSEEVEGVTGKYFSDCKEATLRSDVLDPIAIKKLWENCEKLVKLTPDDPKI